MVQTTLVAAAAAIPLQSTSTRPPTMRKLIAAVLILLIIIKFIMPIDYEKNESVDTNSTTYSLTGPNFSLSLTVDSRRN